MFRVVDGKKFSRRRKTCLLYLDFGGRNHNYYLVVLRILKYTHIHYY
jgi:hypothetical protein